MAQATITLELFKSGIHLSCEETGTDEFIPNGDGNKLMEILNNIQDITDPDTRWGLTEKGKRLVQLLDEGLSWEEAEEQLEKEFPA